MSDIIPPLANFDQFPEETIKLVSFCPVCHYRYNPLEAEILEQNDGANLMYIRCRRCQSTVLALVTISQSGISSFGLITDLNVLEIKKLKGSRPVTDNDLIALHQSLQADRWERELWQLS